MRYAIYFTWNDGTDDSVIENSAKRRDMTIKAMIDLKDMMDKSSFKSISYCPIYANGEYGVRTYVVAQG